MRFPLGRIYMTSGISQAVSADLRFSYEIEGFFERYISGDYGDLCEEDLKANEDAIESGLRVLAHYKTSKGGIYIITEADRSCTTILFCDEY